ncbi:MAG: sn-glycerol-3-phosphate ABC transporter ATP-binding protein UgpC [Actinomycetota bacterium]|nr:sn-glycerol-3-phosphate ABC transporter ATP-binding protein UgpC [Actinomycetota bacterium]MDA8293956.1 sn-glycerol-3-phosphate ABC transporter ATP-binding protein UgpC [Actinomycetota bacterium]
MATVSLDRVTKVYPNGVEAVHELELDVADGEFIVLVGPSGCGKTTALRMVAGLESITAGELQIAGRVMNDVPSKDRDIAMVFQNYALYPHMTVAQNIGFALKLRKLPKDEIARKVREAASILSLTDQLDRKPGQLSGGQRQRVAMGRAIVRDPSVFLMDEPLSNLDAKLRVQMRAEVSRLQRRLGVATLYVTHDQIEAMTMGDRVAVMHSGVLQQCAAPQVLYAQPANLFVAAFIGSPSMNLYEATLSDDAQAIRLGSQAVTLPADAQRTRPGLASYRDRTFAVGIRPEHLKLAGTDDGAARLAADVELVEALGPELLVHFRLDATQVQVGGALSEDEDLGDLRIGPASRTTSAGVARVPPTTAVRVGDQIAFDVATEHLHFFDLQTGAAIGA